MLATAERDLGARPRPERHDVQALGRRRRRVEGAIQVALDDDSIRLLYEPLLVVGGVLDELLAQCRVFARTLVQETAKTADGQVR